MAGIYTGILAVALWNIFINKCWPIQRALPVVVIVLLHALITINFAAQWSFLCSVFIQNGQSFWTVFSKLNSVNQAFFWESGIPSSMSTILADLYIIWCCWMVWGRRWLIVLLPILSLISATVFKIIEIYLEYFNASYEVFPILYASFVLATTLWCTLFIIFRILTVTGVRCGAGDRLRVYRHFIGVLVESSALYSIALVVFLTFVIRKDFRSFYPDVIAGIVKGVAPTLLVGRAAAGHTQPTEQHDESAPVSTLRFQLASQSSQPSQPSTSSFQEFTAQSAVLEIDIEAQRERSDELVVVIERTP
ncbi:uncharacterized protein EV420DRAFT_1028282 [Desarmillaria tabescens]|uniref:Uncharacterized protein n=1 Tax=Armillaria tabescens TaxID=1929756 RepID=A0AA39MRB0_ARMTA|nr:uncharacterized protein EV420DRAFT_1028282 [Desarmillaria tabescens]KAK0443373.1 hypothetical protein EV420DRAFT_1028282 [Desarmillaria tabescens]